MDGVEDEPRTYYNLSETREEILRYVVVEKLGRGRFGVAQLMRHSANNQLLVKKRISLPEDFTSAIPLSELAGIEHSNLVKYTRIEQRNDKCLLVMEYCQNKNLAFIVEKERDLLNGKVMPECQIVKWFGDICCAVEYIHSINIIHRNMKPENILMSNDGRLKLGDYFMTTLFSTSDMEGFIPMSTHLFMAPELWKSNSLCDNKVDIWSIGCLLYYMCTYVPPFMGITVGLIHHAVCNEDPKPLSDVFTRSLHILVGSLLSKKASDRPNATEILKKREFRDIHLGLCDNQTTDDENDVFDTKYQHVRRPFSQHQGRRKCVSSVTDMKSESGDSNNDEAYSTTSSQQDDPPSTPPVIRRKAISLPPAPLIAPDWPPFRSRPASPTLQSPFDFSWQGMAERKANHLGRYPVVSFVDGGSAARDAWLYAVKKNIEEIQLSLPPMRLHFNNTVICAWLWRRGNDLRMAAKMHPNCAVSEDAKCIPLRMRVELNVKYKKKYDKRFCQEQVAHVHSHMGWWSEVMTFKSLQWNKLDHATLPLVSISIDPPPPNGSLWFSGLPPMKSKIDWKKLGGNENWCENWKRIVENQAEWRLSLPPIPVKIDAQGKEVVLIGLLRRNPLDKMCLHIALHYNTPGNVTLSAFLTFTLYLARTRDSAISKKEELLLKYHVNKFIEDLGPNDGPAIDLLPAFIEIPGIPWTMLDPLTPPVATVSITCRSVGGSVVFD